MREKWRDIPDFKGLYQVSNLGNVRSSEREVWNGSKYYTKPEKVLKNNVMKIGYCRVTLTKDGKQEQFYIHRLVADAFIPNPNGLNEIDHIDANPKNNRVSNLRWVTHRENMLHSRELGRNYDGSANLVRGATKRPVIRSDGKRYESITNAARDLGYKSITMVWDVLQGKRPSCRGFSFIYADKDDDR